MSSDGDEPQAKKSKASASGDSSAGDIKKKLQELYKMEFPDDFIDFWTFCVENDSKNPGNVMKKFGLRLGGPYDILLGKKSDEKTDYFLHDRFFYDIPEMQTVIVGNEATQFHIGYLRDAPGQMPMILVSNDAEKDCKYKVLGDNIFAALLSYLESSPKTKKTSVKICQMLRDTMKRKGYKEGVRTENIKSRQKKVVSKGFHNAGIVVPYENEIGWREVPRTDGELKKLFKSAIDENDNALDELQELITYVQFANDECDYGQGLELGQDMFLYGDEKLHRDVKHLLPLAYTLLQFDIYKEIIELHLDNRKKTDVTYLH